MKFISGIWKKVSGFCKNTFIKAKKAAKQLGERIAKWLEERKTRPRKHLSGFKIAIIISASVLAVLTAATLVFLACGYRYQRIGDSDGSAYCIGKMKNGAFVSGRINYSNGMYADIDGSTVTYSTGAVYTGALVNLQRTGEGKIVYTTGLVYEGEFERDMFNGNGRLRLVGGDIYEGNFVDGKKSGTGIYYYAGGDIYKGEYLEDVKSGTGTYYYIGGSVYTGEFKNNLFSGEGSYKIVYADGTVDNYTGGFENGLFSGTGEMRFSGGDVYTGSFRDGMFNGAGRYVTADGTVIDGVFLDGKLAAEE